MKKNVAEAEAEFYFPVLRKFGGLPIFDCGWAKQKPERNDLSHQRQTQTKFWPAAWKNRSAKGKGQKNKRSLGTTRQILHSVQGKKELRQKQKTGTILIHKFRQTLLDVIASLMRKTSGRSERNYNIFLKFRRTARVSERTQKRLLATIRLLTRAVLRASSVKGSTLFDGGKADNL